MAEGAGADYKLSATLMLNDQLSGKLRSAAAQLKSMDGSVGKLAKQFDALKNLRTQVEQFKQMKKAFAATQQAYNQANANTAQLARQYKQGQVAVAQLQAKHDSLKATFDASQSATAQLKNQLGNLKSEATKLKTTDARDEYQKLQAQIKSASEQLKASQATTKQAGAELRTLAGGLKQAQRELTGIGRAFEDSKAKAAKLKQELTSQRPVLDQMRRSLAAQGFSTRDFVQSDRDLRRRTAEVSQKLFGEQQPTGKPISVNVSGNATSKIAQIRTQLQSLTGKAWNVAINAKNAIGTRVNDFATGAAMGLGIPFLGTAGVAYGGVDIINTYKDFEYEMKSVSAITGAYRDETGQRLTELTDLAKYYGETTMFKASEVASAEKYMAMAGWSDEYIKAGLKPLLDLAAASGEDLKRTSDIVTDAMTAFHLKPEEMYKLSNGQMVSVTEHFADVMAALATSSNTDVNMAGESAKYSAAIIGAMYSDQSVQDRMHGMEDWAVFQGLMADTGIKASMAGTANRAIFTRLASMQMNADAAREVLGVDLVYQEDDEFGHQAGQMRRSLDIIGDLRKKFQGGFQTAEELMSAVEYFDESGKKLTKRQRVKIGAMLESAQKNGGKMSKKDVVAMANMLSGQEALSGMLALITADDETWNKKVNAIQNSDGRAGEMANVKLDTLKGDLATLSSAWEAFQLELMEGKGAEGFRAFAQGLTQDIRAFKKAIEDGFDIGDIGGLIARVVTQLKNKFLEFDGIGSILAGGALVMGLKTVYSWAMKLKEAAALTRSWWTGAATGMNGKPLNTARTGTGLAQSVGNMTVHAGTVVVNGKVAGGGGVGVAGGRKVGNTAFVDSYYAQKEQIRNGRFSGMKSAAGGAALFTALFGAMDIYSTREQSAVRLKEADATLKTQKEVLDNMRAEGRSQAEINQQLTEIRNAQTARDQVLQTNHAEELKASMGTVGSVAGAAAGAAIGSIAGPLGMMIGGMIGGMIGDWGGRTVADSMSENEPSPTYRGGVSEKDVSSVVEQHTGYHEEPEPKKAFSEFEGDMWESRQSQLKQGTGIFVAKGENFFGYNGEEFKASAYAKKEAPPEQETTEQFLIRKEHENLQWDEDFKKHQQELSKDFETETMQRRIESAKKQAQGGTALWEQGNAQTGYGPANYGKNGKPKFEGLKGQVQDGTSLAQQGGKVETGYGTLKDVAKGHEQVAEESARATKGLQGFGEFLDGLIFNKAAAAEVTDDQRATEGQVSTEPEPSAKSVEGSSLKQMWDDFNISDLLPDIDLSQWLSGINLPDFKQLWADFNISDLLPDIDISAWLSEKMSGFDVSSLLPDFSSIGTLIDEGLAAIPEKISNVISTIGEGFNRIPALAGQAFNMLSTHANEAITSIQSAWGQLPGFFDGVFSGLGGAAASAGGAILSGLTSVIGAVIGAWQSAASTISGIISSISAMASSIKMPSFGGIGHNATGTTSWRGGFTEINEHGGEILNLPSGTTIYPHATTMKMIEREIQKGTFNDFAPSNEFTSSAFNLGNFAPQPQSNTFLSSETFDFSSNNVPEIVQTPTASSNQNSTTNNSNSNVSITGNTFVIRQESDISEIAFRLLELMRDSNANYAGV